MFVPVCRMLHPQAPSVIDIVRLHTTDIRQVANILTEENNAFPFHDRTLYQITEPELAIDDGTINEISIVGSHHLIRFAEPHEAIVQ